LLIYNLDITNKTLVPFTMFHFFRTSFSLLLIVCGLTACITTPGATPTRSAPSPDNASPAPSIVVSTAQPLPPTAVPDTPITLTLWLPTRFAPQDDSNPAYQVLQHQLDDFARSADGTSSHIVIKQDHGPGGLLDLLRAASPVAPSVLPDVIALNATDLETAARAGLLKPIGSQLPAELLDDLFPFARQLGTLNGELYGLVYSADIEHLASNNATPLPPTWSALLDEPRRYLFVVGNAGNGVSDAVVAHYLSAGGTLTDSNGQPALDELAVQTLLETYQEAQTKGILPNNLTQLNTANDLWTMWRGTGNTLVNLTASQFLSVETRLPELQYAALPSLNKPAYSLGRGWAYAIVANDPRRQAAALRLLQHLLTPANAGEWTQAAGTLPGRAAALTTWEADAYTGFLSGQLAQAQPAPSAAIMAVIGPPLRKAVEDVLAGHATPAEAAHTAALAVNPVKK
jgi:ABC-type glycerol-3-phosphate transport system substrate-binding protein